MRTTVRLDEALLRATKARAAQTGRTMTALIEEALRESLARTSSRPVREPVALPTVRGSGLLPGVDLDDGSALLDLMEGDRP